MNEQCMTSGEKKLFRWSQVIILCAALFLAAFAIRYKEVSVVPLVVEFAISIFAAERIVRAGRLSQSCVLCRAAVPAVKVFGRYSVCFRCLKKLRSGKTDRSSALLHVQNGACVSCGIVRLDPVYRIETIAGVVKLCAGCSESHRPCSSCGFPFITFDGGAAPCLCPLCGAAQRQCNRCGRDWSLYYWDDFMRPGVICGYCLRAPINAVETINELQALEPLIQGISELMATATEVKAIALQVKSQAGMDAAVAEEYFTRDPGSRPAKCRSCLETLPEIYLNRAQVCIGCAADPTNEDSAAEMMCRIARHLNASYGIGVDLKELTKEDFRDLALIISTSSVRHFPYRFSDFILDRAIRGRRGSAGSWEDERWLDFLLIFRYDTAMMFGDKVRLWKLERREGAMLKRVFAFEKKHGKRALAAAAFSSISFRSG